MPCSLYVEKLILRDAMFRSQGPLAGAVIHCSSSSSAVSLLFPPPYVVCQSQPPTSALLRLRMKDQCRLVLICYLDPVIWLYCYQSNSLCFLLSLLCNKAFVKGRDVHKYNVGAISPPGHECRGSGFDPAAPRDCLSS